jgi:thioredoxin 1
VSIVASSKGPVLIEFMTSTCPICAVMAPILENIAEKFKGKVDVYKVNASRDQTLAMSYGIMGVPTFIMFCNGKPISSMSGEIYPALLERMASEALQNGEGCSKKQTHVVYDITGYG